MLVDFVLARSANGFDKVEVVLRRRGGSSARRVQQVREGTSTSDVSGCHGVQETELRINILGPFTG